MPRRLATTCNRELEVSNCSLDHDYADSMVRSQWQSRSRNNYYLLYRWSVAIFVTFVVLYSFIDNAIQRNVGFFFIYFTHWGIMINMVVGVTGAILVTIWHFHDDFHGNSYDSFCVARNNLISGFYRKCPNTKWWDANSLQNLLGPAQYGINHIVCRNDHLLGFFAQWWVQFAFEWQTTAVKKISNFHTIRFTSQIKCHWVLWIFCATHAIRWSCSWIS